MRSLLAQAVERAFELRAQQTEIPLDALTHPENHAIEHWQLPGWVEAREIPFYWIGEYKLWGATYKIVGSIRDFLANHPI